MVLVVIIIRVIVSLERDGVPLSMSSSVVTGGSGCRCLVLVTTAGLNQINYGKWMVVWYGMTWCA